MELEKERIPRGGPHILWEIPFLCVSMQHYFRSFYNLLCTVPTMNYMVVFLIFMISRMEFGLLYQYLHWLRPSCWFSIVALLRRLCRMDPRFVTITSNDKCYMSSQWKEALWLMLYWRSCLCVCTQYWFVFDSSF